MKNETPKRGVKPAKTVSDKPAKKAHTTARKPVSFDVPENALASPSSGWVYRTDSSAPAATPAPLAVTTASSKPAAAGAREPARFFAAVRDAITIPMEIMLSIVVAAYPARRR